jgi:hypothetical protein
MTHNSDHSYLQPVAVGLQCSLMRHVVVYEIVFSFIQPAVLIDVNGKNLITTRTNVSA